MSFFLYLLLPWQGVRFAVHSALPINGVNSMRSGHVTIQRAVADQGEPLERDHGVLAGRHGGGHRGETQVCRLLWKGSDQRGSDARCFKWRRRFEDWSALTLLGPGPPEAEGDEGDDDEDEGPEDNNNYEIGEVAGPRHDSGGGLSFAIWDVRWNRPLLMRTGWGDTMEGRV